VINLGHNKFIVEDVSELPAFQNAKNLYLDFETTSGVPNEPAFNPHRGDRVAGVAVTVDDCPRSYYIPMRHRRANGQMMDGNLRVENVQAWMRDVIGTCDDWVNANVKFDAHFAHWEGADFRGGLYCLTTAAKVLNADMTYNGGYGLKNLSGKWLGHKITDLQDEVKEYLDGVKLERNRKAKDYGLVPIDIMARYACQDAFTARDLHHHIERELPEECRGVLNTERLLTPVLYDMEVEGMRVDPDQLAQSEMTILQELIFIEEKLHKVLGFSCNPSKSSDCYNLLCVHWGLPVLSYSEDGNPSFDKDALIQYLLHPDIKDNPGRTSVVKLVQYYRHRHTVLTFFVRPYQEHQVDGILHPSYNQAVRSGRMSCKRPNAQQLNKEAKSLILPGDGKAFLSCDYSQIEFRLIVHYTKAIEAIRAYENDPDTDFHTWVANMCQIPRSPAKNINFAIGFGAGQKRVKSMLAGNMELMDSKDIKGMSSDEFEVYCRQRSEIVFAKYLDALPGLKPTSRAAARNAASRGYVFNIFGRHLHLPSTHCHIAFNRAVQSTAADIMKERTVALAPRYNEKVRSLELKLAASVHDETLFVGDDEVTRDPKVIDYVVSNLEDVSAPMAKLRVPIRSGAGWSDKDWSVASGDDGALSRTSAWEKFSKDAKKAD